MRIRLMALVMLVVTLLPTIACSEDDTTDELFDATAQPVLTEVPSVVGKTVQFASGVLSTIGSPAVVERVEGLDGIPGTVVEQVPAAGTLVTLGSPVVIRVPDVEDEALDASVDTVADELEQADDTEEPISTTVPPSNTEAPATTLPSTTTLAGESASSTTTLTQPPSTTSAAAAVATTTTAVFAVPASAILTATFAWGENSDRVRLLQQVLGVTVDGIYGPGTRDIHLTELSTRALSAAGVPAAPVATTTT
ncbi:MAG: PASTA domain-containing protein, partial [Actinomycetota bacterium]|nr:PASTA domain-containing protein [Actinomycetota bacterium]